MRLCKSNKHAKILILSLNYEMCTVYQRRKIEFKVLALLAETGWHRVEKTARCRSGK